MPCFTLISKTVDGWKTEAIIERAHPDGVHLGLYLKGGDFLAALHEICRRIQEGGN